MKNFDTMEFGSYVKGRGFKGIICETLGQDMVRVAYHNGIKATTKIISKTKLKEITKEEFIEFCKKKGHTSMAEYISKTND